jgi:maltose O-acetyltransferase
MNSKKTERQKRLAGELYTAADPELTQMLNQARDACQAYNQMACSDQKGRSEALQLLLGKVGGHVDILPPFFCDYGVHIFIGDNVFINYNCVILDCAHVTIGNNVMMGPNVQIYTAYHPLDAQERIKGPELAAPVVIEDNVWIGGGAIICQNLTIGKDSTIGAGSVVTKDIPAGVFAAGNPCRVIKKI